MIYNNSSPTVSKRCYQDEGITWNTVNEQSCLVHHNNDSLVVTVGQGSEDASIRVDGTGGWARCGSSASAGTETCGRSAMWDGAPDLSPLLARVAGVTGIPTAPLYILSKHIQACPSTCVHV
jgi:hypothetical protein